MGRGDYLNPLPPYPRRPKLPYVAGFKVHMRRHVPPPPFGVFYSEKGQGRRPLMGLNPPDLTHSEWYLSHPLQESPPHSDQTVHTLRIVEQIACKESHGPKVVRCSLDEREDQHFVAKIFDPLYYLYPDDVSYNVEKDYSFEAAAYEDLERSGMDGQYTPKYYGSWTFDIPFPSAPNGVRPVRLVLMEELCGSTIASLLTTGLALRIPPVERLDILGRILEIERILDFAGVRHRDVAPRNVMLVGLDLDNYKPPRVFLFDFNVSVSLNRPSCRFHEYPAFRPVNPRLFWWFEHPMEFDQWVPEPHRSRVEVWRGWVKYRWYDSKEFADYEEAGKWYWGEDQESAPVEHVTPYPDGPELPFNPCLFLG